jgi:hypothetical protein
MQDVFESWSKPLLFSNSKSAYLYSLSNLCQRANVNEIRMSELTNIACKYCSFAQRTIVAKWLPNIFRAVPYDVSLWKSHHNRHSSPKDRKEKLGGRKIFSCLFGRAECELAYNKLLYVQGTRGYAVASSIGVLSSKLPLSFIALPVLSSAGLFRQRAPRGRYTPQG